MSEQNTTEGKALAMREYSEIEEIGLPVEKVIAQVQRVQEVMNAVMKKDEHYGIIPGCKKPSLYKPGAEKLGFTFRLAPKFEIIMRDFGNEHREYEVVCRLYTINGEKLVGEGVGSCSTLEAKYRYRTGPKEPTGKPVPKEYWDLRNSEPMKAQAIIGGKGFSVAKSDAGTWEIVQQGEKVEHDNPADYYNTVLKMAKKRAHVDAILTATAASDIFTQDVEELVENGVIVAEAKQAAAAPAAQAPTIQPPKPKATVPPAVPNGNGKHEPPASHLMKIDKVEATEGTSAKGPWKKYSVKVGKDFFSTFSETYGEQAMTAWEEGLLVSIEYKQDGKYKNITHLEVTDVKAEPEPIPEGVAGSPF